MRGTVSRMDARERVQLLGVGVDNATMAEALAKIAGFLERSEPHQVVTADASMLVDAQSDPELAEIIDNASLVTPDGTGILWAARRRGHLISERVSGVDLVDQLTALSAQRGFRIYLLGSAPGVAELAAEKLRLRHPGTNIVGARHGYFPAESDEIVAQEIAESKPDVIFVAMGIPRQEKFIAKTQKLIGAKVAIGVGGSLDVFSGRVRRAPALVQKLRLEWLWRLLLNPSKWRKTMKLPRFVGLVLKQK